jgi:gamma-glutamylcysteine synthetase
MHSPEGKHSIAVACNSTKIRSEESNGLLATAFSHDLSSSDYENEPKQKSKIMVGYFHIQTYIESLRSIAPHGTSCKTAK